jgi:hypothetical protein
LEAPVKIHARVAELYHWMRCAARKES